MENKSLSILINQATEKLKITKSTMLCKYIPNASNTGHMHHFSLEKIIKQNPAEAEKIIQKYIISPQIPKAMPPKPRFPKTKSCYKKSQHHTNDLFVQTILIKAIESKDASLRQEILVHKDFYIQDLKNKIIAAMRNEKTISSSSVQMYNELINL